VFCRASAPSAGNLCRCCASTERDDSGLAVRRDQSPAEIRRARGEAIREGQLQSPREAAQEVPHGWLTVVRLREEPTPRQPRIAFDSQTVTYFQQVNRGEAFPPRTEPLTDLDRQHVATIRLAMAHFPIVVPTVEEECRADPNVGAVEELERLLCTFFLQAVNLEDTNVEARAKQFYREYKRRGDCQIVAEAICEAADVLVTNDRTLRKRLAAAVAPSRNIAF
jgi:hypothetical protein